MSSAARPMRILEALFSDGIGGSEILGLRLAEEFTRRGHTCDILATYEDGGKLKPLLEQSGLEWLATEFTGRSLIKRFTTPIRLFLLFRKRSYDVIHAHHMCVYFKCYWPARLAGIKRLVVTEHAHMHFQGDKKLARRTLYYGSRANCVTVIHRGLEQYLLNSLHIPQSLVRLIPNGVDADRFSPGEIPTLIGNEIDKRGWRVVLGCISRLHRDKDIPNLIRAFHIVVKRSSEKVGLIIVGNGNEREAIEQLIDSLDLKERVWLPGAQSNIPEWLRAFDIFVLPSRREGVPLAILEALGCGLPVVATAVGGIPDVVSDSVGRLVPPEDSNALARAILALSESPHEMSLLSANARQLAKTEFSFRLMADRYLDSLSV